MDHLRRLSDFWNWLPAYRAVAETEHVRTAAEKLRVSPSALSRSIGLLEESVGTQLFDREGRGIRLNPAGRAFLDSLRAAMRLVDEGLKSVESSEFMGTVHIAVPDDMTLPLWKGLAKLGKDHSMLKICLRSVPSDSINSLLSQGQLDLAFSEKVIPSDEVEIASFIETTNGIYCSKDHPLAEIEDPTRAQILDYGFVAGVDESDIPTDRWPVDIRRKVSVDVNRLQGALEASLFGNLLAVLPDHVARSYCDRGLLHKVNEDIVPPCTFYSLRRRQLVKNDTNAQILQVLQDNLAFVPTSPSL